ncbi:LacI family DNA-binding transcriptional regulator [Gleimia hominis]|uniref:LacI family DNA-binding transcriptional regulator n=1 Tax=Gleimia hominis TaxID=595468 RepID=A0ABU3IC55_9ACTO|nr:LacI family DNA-binding transcriptional regulator [Gleimia hominis]MDT3767952.1 LacI family DNA-binding transcriptional regulator [Gleimia hominis]
MSVKPRMADVAKLAGVSVATVSLVLNNTGRRISDRTQQRVWQAAHELGYIRDATARTLRMGKSHSIGFISSEVTLTRFASDMLQGILEAADERDHAVMIMETGESDAAINDAVRALRGRQVDAILIGVMASRDLQLDPPTAGLPCVVLNSTAAGYRAFLPQEFEAGRAAVRALTQRGHQRIGFVGRQRLDNLYRGSVNIGARMQGIDAQLAAENLHFAHEVESLEWEPEVGYEGTLEVLHAAPETTAVLAANDRIAFGVYQAAAELGLKIPTDLSVMSFDDEELAALMRPGLSTLRLPYYEMGRLGVAAVLDEVPSMDAAATSLGAESAPQTAGAQTTGEQTTPATQTTAPTQTTAQQILQLPLSPVWRESIASRDSK